MNKLIEKSKNKKILISVLILLILVLMCIILPILCEYIAKKYYFATELSKNGSEDWSQAVDDATSGTNNTELTLTEQFQKAGKLEVMKAEVVVDNLDEMREVLASAVTFTVSSYDLIFTVDFKDKNKVKIDEENKKIYYQPLTSEDCTIIEKSSDILFKKYSSFFDGSTQMGIQMAIGTEKTLREKLCEEIDNGTQNHLLSEANEIAERKISNFIEILGSSYEICQMEETNE